MATCVIHRVCRLKGSCGVRGVVSCMAHRVCAHNLYIDDVCTHGTPAQMPRPRVCAHWRGLGKDTLKVCASTFFFRFFISPELLSIALEGIGFPLLYSNLMLLLILKCAKFGRRSKFLLFQFCLLLNTILTR